MFIGEYVFLRRDIMLKIEQLPCACGQYLAEVDIELEKKDKIQFCR